MSLDGLVVDQEIPENGRRFGTVVHKTGIIPQNGRSASTQVNKIFILLTSISRTLAVREANKIAGFVDLGDSRFEESAAPSFLDSFSYF